MKAELDENLPPVLARILNHLAGVDGHEVIHVRDLVGAGTKDMQMFSAIEAAGVTVHITMDHHYRRPIEREFIAGSGLTVFVLAKSWEAQSLNAKAAQLIRWWPAIVEQSQRIRPGAIFRVPFRIQGKGRFEMVLNSAKRSRK